MPNRDLFTFCTSLQLLELKAISKLSRVKRFAENDHVYSPGDEGDELFIINRGLVELTPEAAHPGIVTTVLSRGDIFGESGAFLQLKRNQTARARAPLSVQCFRGQDFPELLRRVPSFFLFMCEKLTHHAFQASEIAGSQNSVGELVGNLANFDVATIYQTIIRSMQTGLLTIANEKGEAVCEVYFDSGIPRWGQFQHLRGDEAFWQLFIQTHPGWTFSFSQKALARTEWPDKCELSCSPDELLIKAILMRDEFDEIRKLMSDDTASLKRQQLNFAWPKTDRDDLRPVAEEIWQIAYSQPVSLADLCRRCNLCGLKIYRAVDEMVRAGLFILSSNGQTPVTPEIESGALGGAIFTLPVVPQIESLTRTGATGAATDD